MARRYYNDEDFNATIDYLSDIGDFSGLAKYTAKMAKQLNQRFYRLEKSDIGTSDTAYRFALRESQKKNPNATKPRFSQSENVYNNMNPLTLEKEAKNIAQKLNSLTSTKSGLREAWSNRVEGSLQALNKKGVKLDDKKDFAKFLEKGGGEILNKRIYGSQEIVKEWKLRRKQGLTSEEFIKIYNEEFNNANGDIKVLKKSWKAAVKAKKRK